MIPRKVKANEYIMIGALVEMARQNRGSIMAVDYRKVLNWIGVRDMDLGARVSWSKAFNKAINLVRECIDRDYMRDTYSKRHRVGKYVLRVDCLLGYDELFDQALTSP